jgi:hypothetical protein
MGLDIMREGGGNFTEYASCTSLGHASRPFIGRWLRMAVLPLPLRAVPIHLLASLQFARAWRCTQGCCIRIWHLSSCTSRRHMPATFVAPPNHNEIAVPVPCCSSASIAIARFLECLAEASPPFWLYVCPARVRLRRSSGLEVRRAFEIRLLPHGFLPIHDNSRAPIGCFGKR